MSNKHLPQSGFTLIELLVAIAVFSILIVSFTGGIASTYKQFRYSEERYVAAKLAQEGLELFISKRNNTIQCFIRDLTADPCPNSTRHSPPGSANYNIWYRNLAATSSATTWHKYVDSLNAGNLLGGEVLPNFNTNAGAGSTNNSAINAEKLCRYKSGTGDSFKATRCSGLTASQIEDELPKRMRREIQITHIPESTSPKIPEHLLVTSNVYWDGGSYSLETTLYGIES